jgi:hypothetical protein
MTELDHNALAQKHLEDHKSRLQSVVQQQKVGAEFAMLAVRSLIVVSGGALLAILTFIGNLWTKSDVVAQNIAHSMASAIQWFMFALVMGLATAMLAYLSALAQVYRMTRSGTPLANHALNIRWAAIAAAVISVILIGIGAVVAARGLSGASVPHTSQMEPG